MSTRNESAGLRTGAGLTFPQRRAFVVWFSAESDAEKSLINGRVEHVSSGEKAGFGSLDELWAFARNILVHGTTPSDPRAASQPAALPQADELRTSRGPHRSHATPAGTKSNPRGRES